MGQLAGLTKNILSDSPSQEVIQRVVQAGLFSSLGKVPTRRTLRLIVGIRGKTPLELALHEVAMFLKTYDCPNQRPFPFK